MICQEKNELGEARMVGFHVSGEDKANHPLTTASHHIPAIAAVAAIAAVIAVHC